MFCPCFAGYPERPRIVCSPCPEYPKIQSTTHLRYPGWVPWTPQYSHTRCRRWSRIVSACGSRYHGFDEVFFFVYFMCRTLTPFPSSGRASGLKGLAHFSPVENSNSLESNGAVVRSATLLYPSAQAVSCLLGKHEICRLDAVQFGGDDEAFYNGSRWWSSQY